VPPLEPPLEPPRDSPPEPPAAARQTTLTPPSAPDADPSQGARSSPARAPVPADEVAAARQPAEPARPAVVPPRLDERAPSTAADEAADQLQRGLADLRRWLQEPPRDAGEGRRESAAPAPLDDRAAAGDLAMDGAPPVLEQRTEVSIGTIVVSVEEPPTAPAAATRPRRPDRPATVPRHWVRGW
jgi:hypothetical protein